jgi:hypothetical protein
MHAAPCSPIEAARLLAPVLDCKANPFGAMTMDELLTGQRFLVTDESGEPVGAYVLRGQGAEVWIQAAAGSASVDLCDLFDELVIKHGAGFKSIAFRTYRPGLVKKAQQRGYATVNRTDDGAFIMRKKLQ